MTDSSIKETQEAERPPSFVYASGLTHRPNSLQKTFIDTLTCSSNGTLSSAMTTVTVGSESEVIVVYADLLSFWSPRIRDDFVTFGRQSLKLCDVKPLTFKVFLDWAQSDGARMPKWDVHMRSDDIQDGPYEVDDLEVVADTEAYYHSQPEAQAVECYIFAHNYGIRQFMNDLFDSILEMIPNSDLVPSYSIVLKVWTELPAASYLRKYLIDLFARNWTHNTDIGYREELILRKQVPSQFWIAILTLRSKHDVLDDYPPWEYDLCQYHDHKEGEKEKCYWQHINDGKAYCTEFSDDTGSEMDEYESGFIDDKQMGSDEDNVNVGLTKKMDKDTPLEAISSTESPASNGSMTS